MRYLLDTNIILTYLRDNQQARNFENNWKLMSGEHELICSSISIGELKSIAKRNNWGNKRIENMINLINYFLISDINVEGILEKYAEIDAFSQDKLTHRKSNFSARNMGKNDVWIAATASFLQVPLITMDKDFQHLENEFIALRIVDLEDYK
jgi:tRNA(fMet)-specific endonuclease VapC